MQAFLQGIAANNNREWFQANRAEYDTVKADFEQGLAELIAALATIDPEIAHLKPKDCTYRFNRDTRFSPDKVHTNAILVLIFVQKDARHCVEVITSISNLVITLLL